MLPDEESFTEIRVTLPSIERWRQLRKEDGGRKMAAVKAREGNKKAGGEASGVRGPAVTSHSVISL